MRQVGVHLADDVGVARQHAAERVDVGAAEAPAPAAVQHLHPPRMLAGEGVGDRAGAVGRVVVDDEHAVVALSEHVRDQHREVVALVVGRDHDGDVHAPCDSSCYVIVTNEQPAPARSRFATVTNETKIILGSTIGTVLTTAIGLAVLITTLFVNLGRFSAEH